MQALFCLLVGAIGVDSNSLDPNANLGDVGLSWQKDASWGNYFVTTLTAYGDQVTLQNALVYSDNIYFARQRFRWEGMRWLTD